MFERPKSGEQALLVHINFKHHTNADLREFKELARAAGARVCEIVTATRDKPDPTYYVGRGKLDDIASLVHGENIELVVFNHDLSPGQERNIEKFLKCRVLSRTGLILDIFAQRARTFEGKLQVELAQLQHLSTRLIRGWTHLERQKGGIGLRGPGETQLETDRRLLRQRIKSITAKLDKVRKQRDQSRRKRQRAELITVALVGYTNAGKSTIFNILTDSDVLVANQLFATLDPTLRTMELPTVSKVVVADTVGFVRHLPHDLVDAFRATLEETRYADLLLHVVDRHDPNYQDTIYEVNQVLNDIGAGEIPQLLVFNKLDLLPDLQDKIGTIDRNEDSKPQSVWICAQTKVGFDSLREAIQECLVVDIVHGTLHLQSQHASIRARLFELGGVLSEQETEEGWRLHIRLPKRHWHQLCHHIPELETALEDTEE